MRQITKVWLLSFAAVALTWGSAALAQHAHGDPKAPPQAMAASTPASAAKPARKPRSQLGIGTAFAPDGTLWWVGLNADNQLVIQNTLPAESRRSQWSAPRVIDLGGDPVSADGENHPKLLFGPNATVLIAYTQPLAKPNTGFVRLLRSTDGGKTFSSPARCTPTGRKSPTASSPSASMPTVCCTPSGSTSATWRPHPRWATSPATGARPSTAPIRWMGVPRLARTSRWPTTPASAAALPWRKATTVVMNAMWRHVYEPDVRDHAFAALGATTTAPAATVRATFDEWHVNGCPHHGPGLVAAAEGGFHTVWFGIRQQDGANASGVRYARLKADGSPDAQTVRRLPDDRAEHADVMAQGQRVAIVWRSSDGLQTTLKAWLSTDGGKTFTERTLAQVQGDNDFARPVQHGTRMAVVWRNPKEVQVYELNF